MKLSSSPLSKFFSDLINGASLLTYLEVFIDIPVGLSNFELASFDFTYSKRGGGLWYSVSDMGRKNILKALYAGKKLVFVERKKCRKKWKFR